MTESDIPKVMELADTMALNARSRVLNGDHDYMGMSKVYRAALLAELQRLALPQGEPKKCKYGDPRCPCQDGDQCHYEGKNPMTPPSVHSASRSGGHEQPSGEALTTASTESYAEPLTNFQEGQWWVIELDAMVSDGTADQKRAVAVVHHMLRSAGRATASNSDCGEPVAWIEHHKAGDNLGWEPVNHPYAKATPLYASPPSAVMRDAAACKAAQDDAYVQGRKEQAKADGQAMSMAIEAMEMKQRVTLWENDGDAAKFRAALAALRALQGEAPSKEES